MIRIFYTLLFVVLLSLLLPVACTKKKSECADCFGIVEAFNSEIIKWNFDSVKYRNPNAIESQWREILDQIDGKPVQDKNGNTIGTFRKECPTITTP